MDEPDTPSCHSSAPRVNFQSYGAKLTYFLANNTFDLTKCFIFPKNFRGRREVVDSIVNYAKACQRHQYSLANSQIWEHGDFIIC